MTTRCELRGPRSAGFTLIEVAIASIVLAVMSAVIAQSLRQMSVAQSTMHAKAKIASVAERVVGVIEDDVKHSVRVFGESPTHRAFLERLELLDFLRPVGGLLAGSRLPVATSTGQFEADGEEVETGNLLMAAVRDGQETVEATVSGVTFRRRIDIRRFVVWALHPGKETGVDLAQWRSVRTAHLPDLSSILPVERQVAVIRELRDRGIGHAWDASAAADSAFKILDSSGGIADLSASASGLVPGDPVESSTAVLGLRFVGVAPNGTISPAVPAYGNPTLTFPHGFEVKHDGDGSGDLLLIRLVVRNADTEGRVAVLHEVVRQIAFRTE